MFKHCASIFLLASLLILPAISLADDRGISVVGNASDSQHRVALVIGNANYQSSPLRNSVNDAEDTASALRNLGFQVTLGTDMTRKEMRRVIRTFGESLKQGGVGLFYYAGHGMQVGGTNYLIPIGADIGLEDEVQDEAVDAGLVLRKMDSAGNAMNMVFLDACRDNPFARSFRSSFKGLAQMDAPTGSLIVYATAPGSVAADGEGRNGIFTKNLLAHLNASGVELSQMMKSVRSNVRKETGGKQVPWESSSLEGNFYFAPSSETTKQTPRPVPTQPPVQLQSSSPSKMSLDEKIKSALRRKKEVEREYSKLEQMATLDASIISADEKIKAIKGFIDNYPNKNHKLEDANSLLTKLEEREQIERQLYEEDALLQEKRLAREKKAEEKKKKREKYLQMVKQMPRESQSEKPSSKCPDKMSFIPGGVFLAGKVDALKEMNVDNFCMDKYEVIQAKYERVIGENPSFYKGENHPVEHVTWYEAKAYCEKVGKRLPTEWEWEKAAKAGTTTKFYWGDELLANSANCNGCGSLWDGDEAAPIGSFAANQFGLYDMAGNVAEWTDSDFNSFTSFFDGHKVVRGGSWFYDRSEVESASRSYGNSKGSVGAIGFRCAK